MKSLDRREIVRALEQDRSISDIVEQLKQEIRREPFRESAHRLLGDLYLTRLNHGSYAVAEYRKLLKIQDKPNPTDQLRLAWSYLERDFEEKCYRTLMEIDRAELPDKLTVLDETIVINELIQRLEEELGEIDSKRSRSWFEKKREEAMEYLETGNPFQAQQAFDKALDYKDDPDVRAKLARCMLSRRNYPSAVENLKEVLSTEPDHPEALELLEKAYERLGIDPEISDVDRSTQEERHRTG